jgi:UDP-N-acetylglucosamine diphosphorylase / glucose-1-phosphate thymidylyltransferase / UDP-N-acetylgalactosamine diphosphorylase / glucosamine-1-phosphate N-acetyltransferase / galactosamine-1-phosphate N-acetyltransferase
VNIWIDNVPALPGCLPVTATRALADMRVAGASFASLVRAEIDGADERTAPDAAVADVVMAGNAWIAREDWRRFAAHPNAVTLTDARGEVLAWRPGSGESLPAASGSRLIRFSWDILGLNETLVNALTASRIEGELSAHAHVDGHLVLGRGSRVLPGVYVEGNVVVGENCKIGPNCYLRGATSIGDGCHIGQSVEIKNCLIGTRTNVGHLSYVGDSILGDRVNFGAGTTVSNLRHDGKTHRTLVGGVLVDTGRRKFGTVVGDGVHTGINTSIYPGRKLGVDSSTRPAAVVQRDLADGEQGALPV